MTDNTDKGLFKRKTAGVIALFIAAPMLFIILHNSFSYVNILKVVDYNIDSQTLLEEEPDADFSSEDDELPAMLLKSEIRDVLLNAQGNVRIKDEKVPKLLNQVPGQYGKITAEVEKRPIYSQEYTEYTGKEGYSFRFVFYAKDQTVCPLKETEFICLEDGGNVIIISRKKTIYKDVELLENRLDISIYSYDVSPHALWVRYVNDNGKVIREKSGIERISGWSEWARSM